MLTQINDNKVTKLVLLRYSGCFSFPDSPSSSFPFPNDLRRNPLNIKTAVRAIATMVFPRGAWSTKAVTKEIAPPIRLNGSHFLIAK